MDVASHFPLAMFVLTSTITPGGATTLATASGLQFGFRRSLPLLAGICAGLATMAAVSAAGLSSLLIAAPQLHLAMKVAGTSYMLWLALKIARAAPRDAQRELAKPFGFLTAAGLLWMNPKAWTMCAGAAASFSVLAAHPLHFAALLGVAFSVASAISLSIWCAAGLLLARLMGTAQQRKILNRTLGFLLAASIVPMWL